MIKSCTPVLATVSILLVSSLSAQGWTQLSPTASLTLPISNDPTLVGLTYYNQAFVIDPPRFTMSNGPAATISQR